MQMIRIDTAELTQAAETLRAAAVEAADIGAGLSSCAQCSMPPWVQGMVDKIVVAADQALDASASQLGAQAVDLVNRAVIAQHDALTAAGVSWLVGAPALVGGSSANLIAETPAFSPRLIGGGGSFTDAVHVEPLGYSAPLVGGFGSFTDAVHVEPRGYSAPLVGGFGSFTDAVHVEPRGYSAPLVGGVGSFSDAIHTTPMPWGGSITLGGVRNTSGFDRLMENGLSNGTLTAGQHATLTGFQLGQYNGLNTWFGTPRRELEAEAGGVLSRSEVFSRDPNTFYG